MLSFSYAANPLDGIVKCDCCANDVEVDVLGPSFEAGRQAGRKRLEAGGRPGGSVGQTWVDGWVYG